MFTYIKAITNEWNRDYNKEAKMKLEYLEWKRFQRELESMEKMKSPREF